MAAHKAHSDHRAKPLSWAFRLALLLVPFLSINTASAQSGTCCTANGTPGCVSASCQTFICSQDPFCCSTFWDALCASAAVANANAGGPCAGVSDCPGAPPPPTGCVNHTITITGGSFPSEVSWQLIGPTGTSSSGGAPLNQTVCLAAGCYTMHLYDSWGDGWNGASFTIALQSTGQVVSTGTLSIGSYGTVSVNIGGGCGSTAVTASDCVDAANVCTDLNFSIDPNGFGSVNEIPPSGSIGNPYYSISDGMLSPWGTDNWGCLQGGELNSTWMVINIWTGGSLEFTFGGLGTQAGYYDWIMYPYNENTCSQIPLNQVPPVRCNWNGASFGGTGLASTIPSGGSYANYEPPLNVQAGEQYIICFSNWSSISTSVPLQFGGTAVVDCQDVTILPVELIHFEAQAQATSTLLRWTTVSEAYSDRFEVERSIDLWHWDALGHVGAAGQSHQTIDYSYHDESPHSGVNFYRLHIVDVDGSSEYSPIRSVTWTNTEVRCHPNPSMGTFRLHNAAEEAPIAVFDAMGRPVQASLQYLGDGITEVHLAGAGSGVYTVRIGEGSGLRSERMQVMVR